MKTLGPILALLVASLTFGCSAEPAVQAPTPDGELPVPAPPVEVSAEPESGPVRFLANYPATLLYALDGAAGRPNHDPGYRRWLVGDEQPTWLDAYARRRPSWNLGGGPTDAPDLETCGWSASDVDELLACVEGVVPAVDVAVAVTALREADRLLRPRWEEISKPLRKLVPALEAVMQSPAARELLRTLRDESSLPAAEALRFDVVLVVKPSGPHSYAQQQGHFLVHEVGARETAGGLSAVTFHEIAHLAHALSPARESLDRAFMTLGDRGKVAAHIWDEAVATAFGNGLAAERVDPDFRPAASLYADPWIDAVGRALYLDWKGGYDVRLGPELAAHLAKIVDNVWPADERTASRYLWYCDVRADDASVLKDAFAGIQVRGAYWGTPILDEVPGRPQLPVWATRVVLATREQLVRRPALRRRTEMPAESWIPALPPTNAAVFRHDDPDGTLVLVIVAETAATLAKAMPAFARLTMVPPGWTSFDPK